MPFCVLKNLAIELDDVQASTVEIFYQLYGHGDVKVLLVSGTVSPLM